MAGVPVQQGSWHWKKAPQPHIVRAAQKDDLYLAQSVEALQAAVLRLLGPAFALQHGREVRLVAHLVYYALTTGTGQQTLGEEYCDLLQRQPHQQQRPHRPWQASRPPASTSPPPPPPAAAAGGAARQHDGGSSSSSHLLTSRSSAAGYVLGIPSLMPRRSAVGLTVLQSLGPYLLDRLISSLGSRGEGGMGLEGDAAWMAEEEEQQQQGVDKDRGTWGSSSSGSGTSSGTSSWQQRLQAGRRWLSGHLPQLRGLLAYLDRLHLAAFYLTGVYYQWSKRLMGVRYTSVSAVPESRASYQVLGLLLLAQLLVSAALQAGPLLVATVGSGPGQQGLEQGPRHAVVLPDKPQRSLARARRQQQLGQGSEAASGAAAAAAGAAAAAAAGGVYGGGSEKRCPLCLSPRANPTCAPCGHVFCWLCIAQWVTEKPECPLCRAAVTTSQLVCVYHSDL